MLTAVICSSFVSRSNRVIHADILRQAANITQKDTNHNHFHQSGPPQDLSVVSFHCPAQTYSGYLVLNKCFLTLRLKEEHRASPPPEAELLSYFLMTVFCFGLAFRCLRSVCSSQFLGGLPHVVNHGKLLLHRPTQTHKNGTKEKPAQLNFSRTQ